MASLAVIVYSCQLLSKFRKLKIARLKRASSDKKRLEGVF